MSEPTVPPPLIMPVQIRDEKEIYKFLVANWHHHNTLSWTKLNVMLALEGASLVGSAQAHPLAACGLMVAGSIAVLILYRLVQRDWEIRDYCEAQLAPFQPLGLKIRPDPLDPKRSGRHLLSVLLNLIWLTNAVAVLVWFCKYLSSR